MHQPVLLKAVIEKLDIHPAGFYIDATYGRGGHSKEILKKLNPEGRLIAIDKDKDAIKAAQQDIQDTRFRIFQGSFGKLEKLLEQENLQGKISGILMDLGVSSPQLTQAGRGFSFRLEGPLDMRMDTGTGISLADWLQTVGETKLCHIIKTYGEEHFAKRIAKNIIQERNKNMITTTTQLADIIAKAHPAWDKHKHPATRTFQALRIFINNELEDISLALPQCLNILKIGGRLLVISFHSLEDRIVKNFINHHSQGDAHLRKLPLKTSQLHTRLRRMGKAIRPDMIEINQNSRARSAVLRIAEKIQ